MRIIRSAALALSLLASTNAAHAAPRAWLLPSDTAFSGGGDDWMTVDAAISTDLYYFDHPAQPWEPVAYAPDGSSFPVENKASGKLRSTFDVHLTKPGTYKVAVVANTVMGSYLLNGERKPLPRGTTEATLAKAVPEGATEVWSAPANLRIETFATAGEPTTAVFTPTGKGLEMVPVTHPADLAVGEGATFQFLLDGKPAAGLPVTAIPGGVRYRAGLGQIDTKTDAQGKVTIKWPAPGMYWVSATTAAPRGPEAATPAATGAPPAGEGPRPMTPPQRRDTYVMTVEVIG
jgi:uncharacterized GH25 family protein